VRVAGGQSVEKGTPLIEVEPSPDAKVQLIEARNALDAANRELALTKERAEMKLATNLELGQAQEAVKSAQVKLDALQQRGAGEDNHVITADGPGLISKVDVQEGQIVPAGGPLVESVPHDRIEVRLGVEPSDVRRLHLDQPVRIFPAGGDDDEPTAGKIRLIAQRVSPETRLVDVFVTPAAPDGEPATQPTTEASATTQPTTQADAPTTEPATAPPLLLEAFVRGELTAESKQAMVVPRDAVLPDDEGLTLFTVEGGKAVKHTVKIGLQNDKEVEVIGEGLHAGDPVVIVGNLELEDGMAVTTGESSSPTTPTTAGAARD
jgi:multidrug resistance efflux pump